jgi:GNAT superfamily N-acetyltransferase
VGIARAIGDGVYCASIVDVIVHPDLQRSGVGTALVAFLEARLSSLVLLTLTAAPAVQPFYERIG